MLHVLNHNVSLICGFPLVQQSVPLSFLQAARQAIELILRKTINWLLGSTIFSIKLTLYWIHLFVIHFDPTRTGQPTAMMG
jgi:hypothetical protein